MVLSILRALQANRWTGWNTAEELKMSYRALLYKLRDVGLPQRRRAHRDIRRRISLPAKEPTICVASWRAERKLKDRRRR